MTKISARSERARLVSARAEETAFFEQFKIRGYDAVELMPPEARPKLSAMLAAKRRIKNHYSESNFGPMSTPIDYGGVSYFYGYQRINLRAVDHVAAQPYKNLKFERPRDAVTFSFTSCGQSALSLSILIAMQMFESRTLVRTASLYYETHEFLRDYGIDHVVSTATSKTPKKKGVLLIDSSTEPRGGFDEDWSRYACVIVDTTCWSLGSARISALVSEINGAGADVMLARSHIKLDCLGTEWNRLGSVLFVTRKPPAHTDRFCDQLVKKSKPFGAVADLRQIYPFLQSPQFHVLNERWVARLKTANRALGAKLVSSTRRLGPQVRAVETFSHDLFSLLVVPAAKIQELEAQAAALAKRLTAAGLPAHTITSYPWDFVSLTAFVREPQDARDVRDGVFRISAPALAKADIALTSEVVTAWARAGFT